MRAGDDKYRAPEVNEDSFQPHPKNDVFSLGMTLLEMAGDFYLPNGGIQWMLLRKNKFPSSQLKESTYSWNIFSLWLIICGLHALFFAAVSDELIQILHHMLRKELDERPLAGELLCVDEIKMKMVERQKVSHDFVVQKLSHIVYLQENSHCTVAHFEYKT